MKTSGIRRHRGKYFDPLTMTYRWKESNTVAFTYEQLQELELASGKRIENHVKENQIQEDTK